MLWGTLDLGVHGIGLIWGSLKATIRSLYSALLGFRGCATVYPRAVSLRFIYFYGNAMRRPYKDLKSLNGPKSRDSHTP